MADANSSLMLFLALSLTLSGCDQSAPVSMSKDSVEKARDSEILQNRLGMNLRFISAGSFSMGSDVSSAEIERRFHDHLAKAGEFEAEFPSHRVTISKPFYMGVHEVTVGQFQQFVGSSGYRTEAESNGVGGWGWNEQTGSFVEPDPKFNWKNPGFDQTEQHPVVNVSWNDSVAFCRWLSDSEGRTYRLPTEAEWEYACRAGTTTLFCCGNDPDQLAQSGNIVDLTLQQKYSSWNPIAGSDGFVFTAPVGQYIPNRFGIYDMHGNAYEWCSDWYAEDYYQQSPPVDPIGPETGKMRALRGGAWAVSPHLARSAFRNSFPPDYPQNMFGFRVVCEAQQTREHHIGSEGFSHERPSGNE